jgi:hypothetical protein
VLFFHHPESNLATRAILDFAKQLLASTVQHGHRVTPAEAQHLRGVASLAAGQPQRFFPALFGR